MPADLDKLSQLIAEARKDFLHEVGDTPNMLLANAELFALAVDEAVVDDMGHLMFKGLELVHLDSGRKIMLARAVDPLEECENCRGL